MKKFLHDYAKKAVENSAEIKNRLEKAVDSIDINHKKITDHADTTAKVARVAAGAAVVGASMAAPTGLTAVGVSLGVISAPLIVTAAPIIVSVAGAALTVSAGVSLYSKYRSNEGDTEVEIENKIGDDA